MSDGCVPADLRAYLPERLCALDGSVSSLIAGFSGMRVFNQTGKERIHIDLPEFGRPDGRKVAETEKLLRAHEIGSWRRPVDVRVPLDLVEGHVLRPVSEEVIPLLRQR